LVGGGGKLPQSLAGNVREKNFSKNAIRSEFPLPSPKEMELNHETRKKKKRKRRVWRL